MSEKPWTEAGLSSRERAACAVEKLAQIMDIEQGLEVVSEAINAAVRDAAPKWVRPNQYTPVQIPGSSYSYFHWIIAKRKLSYARYNFTSEDWVEEDDCYFENVSWIMPNVAPALPEEATP